MACNHCEHCENIEHIEEKESKKDLVLYIISVIVFCMGFIPVFSKYNIIIYLLVILLAGYYLIIEGIKNIFKLNFEEDTLMTIAIIAAFVLGEFPESCMVVLLFRLRRIFGGKGSKQVTEEY